MSNKKTKIYSGFLKEEGKTILFTTSLGLAVLIGYKYGNQIFSTIKRFFNKPICISTEGLILNENKTQIQKCNGTEIVKHIYVSGYIRNLPLGHNISTEKLKVANEFGYNIGNNQTWVKAYTYNKKTK